MGCTITKRRTMAGRAPLKIGSILLLLMLPACSSFGIRTSTQIPYVQTGDDAVIILNLDGSIPGSEIESDVNIDKILDQILFRIKRIEEDEGEES